MEISRANPPPTSRRPTIRHSTITGSVLALVIICQVMMLVRPAATFHNSYILNAFRKPPPQVAAGAGKAAAVPMPVDAGVATTVAPLSPPLLHTGWTATPAHAPVTFSGRPLPLPQAQARKMPHMFWRRLFNLMKSKGMDVDVLGEPALG